MATLALGGCSASVVDTYCLNYQPITYSAAGDTEDTKRQIKANNAVYTKLCS